MKNLIFLFGLFLIGCEEYANKTFIVKHTEEYFIPDSNKQKYADFVSRSVSGCEESCSYFLDDVKKEGGRIYGIEYVNIVVRSEANKHCNASLLCFDSVLKKSELSSVQIEMANNFLLKEN